jgi:pilus assembly protein CpaE
MDHSLERAGPGAGEKLSRPNRATVLAFIADQVSEQVLRDGLAEFVADGLDIRRGNIKTAIITMTKLQTPEVLIVDISGEEYPSQSLRQLSEVVEPSVRVLAIGETDEVEFYRDITHGLGVAEYLFKPITREAVARHFVPMITRKNLREDTTGGGRVVAVMAARGGAGGTTIAANVACYLGMSGKRHTVFVDTDLHMGFGAMLLGGKTGPGLRMALESPDPLDPLFADDAPQPIADRLHILAGDEPILKPLHYAPGAAQRMIEALRVRYNFIILDLPFLPVPSHRELLDLAHHRVVVMDPTLASVRDTLRLLALPRGPWQPQSPTLVLNRYGRPGSLTRKQIEDALKAKIDVVIPELSKQLQELVGSGKPLVSIRGPFLDAIIDLSREIGFVGLQDGFVTPAHLGPSIGSLFKGLVKARG